jgi:RNA polymerase sigma factor (sigma-70 family)
VVVEFTTAGLSRVQSELAAQMAAHDRLVAWVVRRQRLGSLSFAEALQAGRIGLWHALCHYDPTRGTAFSSYAVPAIARAIWDEVAAASPSPLLDVGEEVNRWEETDPGERLDQAQVRATLHALVAALPERLRAVVVAHYGLDGTLPQTFAQIGKGWGVSRQRVHQLHVAALLGLAQPSASHALRRLVERQHRTDYQRTLARQRQVARRTRRGTPRVHR